MHIGAGQGTVIQMHVAVDKAAGGVFVHQLVETLEPPVGQVLAVVQAPGRGVGQQDIEPAAAQQLITHTLHAAGHLLLGILEGAGLVAHTAAQAQNPQAAEIVDRILNTSAALRGMELIGGVVIAVHIQHRRVGERGNEGQILGL